MYGLTTTTPPAAEPVTLAEAKSHLRVDYTDEDAWITGAIATARELSEAHTSHRWVTQGVRLTLADWPCEADPHTGLRAIRLPCEPVQAVTGVSYYDAAGTLRTLDGADWQVWLDHSPPLVAPAPGETWPTAQADRLGAVRVEFTAGYGGAGAVPERVKQAIKLAVGYWFENRGDGKDPHQLGLPAAAVRLLDSISTGGYG